MMLSEHSADESVGVMALGHGSEPRSARLDFQRHFVQLVVVQQQSRVQQVVGHFGDQFNFVRCLLEVADLADHVRNLLNN
jgi:hypothetical protein